MAGIRGLLYTLAKLMGDHNAVKKGKVGKRVGRRVAGKATGKAMQEDPDQAPVVLANRREQHRANMDLTLQGIKRLAETGS